MQVPREIPGSEGGRVPIWSPDGSVLAYTAGGKLWKIPSAVGQPVAICDLPTTIEGGSWEENGTIVLSANTGPIFEVSAGGGDPRPLLKPEEVGSLLSVSAQMVNILTEQNVAQSLATLNAGDIYIKPDLAEITAADIEKHQEAAQRGRAAAEGAAVRLQALAVSEKQFAQWWGRIAAAEKKTAPRIDEIEIGLAFLRFP